MSMVKASSLHRFIDFPILSQFWVEKMLLFAQDFICLMVSSHQKMNVTFFLTIEVQNIFFFIEFFVLMENTFCADKSMHRVNIQFVLSSNDLTAGQNVNIFSGIYTTAKINKHLKVFSLRHFWVFACVCK